MSRGEEAYHRLRAAYAEFRSAVAVQRDACASGDAESVLAAAVEGDWQSARIAELYAERPLHGESADPGEQQARAACAAEATALAAELDALLAAAASRRDALATELASLPSPAGPGAYRAPDPALFDAHG